MNEIQSDSQKLLSYIVHYQTENGYSPSLKELKSAMDTRSTRGIGLKIKKLEKLGLIERIPNSRRAIKVLGKQSKLDSIGKTRAPIVGEVKAGYGGITEERIEGYREIPTTLTQGRTDILLLRIKGESMTKAGYNPGDLAIVIPQSTANDGDIVVVYDYDNNDETVKRLKKLKGYMALLPETDDLNCKPRIGTNFSIQGKVVNKVPTEYL